MPYGVTVEGDGVSRRAIFATRSKHSTGDNSLRLPAGPCRIAASWNGPESVRVTVLGVGYPIVINAGGGYRSAMAVVGAKGGEPILLENEANAPLTKGRRGSIEVYPLNFE